MMDLAVVSPSTAPHADAPTVPVSVILVNWNGWQDTLLCLQSLMAMHVTPAEIIVCDNGSSDGSLDRLRAWADGRLTAWVPPSHPARASAEVTARPHRSTTPQPIATRSVGPALVLIDIGANLGFGGGNNVGMTHVQRNATSEYVWLLNNDTAVAPDALVRLLALVAGTSTNVLASSRVMYMQQPAVAWFEGGVFDSITATARHVPPSRFRRSATGFLSGCALLIGRRAWQTIGLLDADRFFMYGEDIDYSLRARAAGIPLVLAEDSLVLHAVSASSKVASPFAYRHNVASVIRVSRKHFAAWRVLPMAAYHVTKLFALAILRRPGLPALRAYWQGIVSGFA